MSGRDQVAARALRAGWAVGSRVPDAFATRMLNAAADQTWRARGSGVRQLERNLARAAPGAHDDRLRKLGRKAMRSYLRYWGETFQLSRWSEQDIRDRIVVHDEHRLHDAYASGRGVVGALPHSGNWDLAGAWACLSGMPLTTVAERVRPERLYADFVAYRASLGMEILPLSGAGPSLRLLVERLRAGRFVPLLADRDLSRGGVVVPLLGEDASVPSGPARLAQLTGATLLPITCDYAGPQGEAGQMHLRMHEPVPHVSGRAGAVAMTSAVADVFSAAILAAPADWHMLQRVFVADPAAAGR